MTAVRAQRTLDTLRDVTELAEFIRHHGDRLGVIASVMSGGHVQIEHTEFHSNDADVAGSLINWAYLLDDIRVTVMESMTRWKNERCAHTTVHGKLQGREVKAYTVLYGDAGAYLLSLPELTVHSLRRVQVGDVPEVVAA
jgi:hypothetical protein